MHVSIQAPTGVYTWKRMILTEVKHGKVRVRARNNSPLDSAWEHSPVGPLIRKSRTSGPLQCGRVHSCWFKQLAVWCFAAWPRSINTASLLNFPQELLKVCSPAKLASHPRMEHGRPNGEAMDREVAHHLPLPLFLGDTEGGAQRQTPSS